MVLRLTHMPTGYYFLFDYDEKGQRSEFRPGATSSQEVHKARDWDERYHQVSVWARYVAREARSIDLLATIMTQPPLEVSVMPDGNRPFDEAEQADILGRLDRLEQRVIEVKTLTENERTAVKQEFETLRIEVKRASRNGFIRMVVGTVFSIAARLLFTKEEALQAWHFTIEQFGNVVRALTHHHG